MTTRGVNMFNDTLTTETKLIINEIHTTITAMATAKTIDMQLFEDVVKKAYEIDTQTKKLSDTWEEMQELLTVARKQNAES